MLLHLPAARCADPGPVSRARACPREVVFGRYPLPYAVQAGARSGAGGQIAEPAPPPRQPGNRSDDGRAPDPRVPATAVAGNPPRRHGPDGDRRAGGLAVARSDLLRRAGRPGDPGDAAGQRQHRRHLRQVSRPLRRARHGAVPGARTGGRRIGAAIPFARPARHRDRRQRRRRGPRGAEILADLPEMRGTGPRPVHAPDRVYRDEPHGAVASRQSDRQSARIDGRGASPDLRRGARRLSRPQAGDRPWRRVPAGLFRAASTTARRRGPIPASASTTTRRTI